MQDENRNKIDVRTRIGLAVLGAMQRADRFLLKEQNGFSIKWISDHLKNYAIAAAIIGLGFRLLKGKGWVPLGWNTVDTTLGILLSLIGMTFGTLNYWQFVRMTQERLKRTKDVYKDGRASMRRRHLLHFFGFVVMLGAEIIVGLALFRTVTNVN